MNSTLALENTIVGDATLANISYSLLVLNLISTNYYQKTKRAQLKTAFIPKKIDF